MNPAIRRRLALRSEPEKRYPRNVWRRFFEVWKKLTDKQQVALKKVYMDSGSLTKSEAANLFGISVDSLISRLKTATQKLKAEFPNLRDGFRDFD